MATTYSGKGNGGNGEKDKREGEEKQCGRIGPIPKNVKTIIKKKRRLTDLSRDPMSIIDYSDILQNITEAGTETKQEQHSQQVEQIDTTAEKEQAEQNAPTETKPSESLVADLEEALDGLDQMIRARDNVLAGIRVVSQFLSANADSLQGVPVRDLQVCLEELRNFVEGKNEEDDAYQKKITDYFRSI